MAAFENMLTAASNFLWGIPLIVLVVGGGLIVSVATGFIVFRKFGFIMTHTFGTMFQRQEADEGGITPFQAVSTALAATIGTGNVVGVATAVASGGPGAVFWMWLAALFGMTTKFVEVTLAVAYRERNELGEFSGGPMYYLKNGLGMDWLGKIFAFFAAIAAFGIGCMVQSNSMAGALQGQFNIPPYITGIVLAVLSGAVLIGGIKRIGQVTEKIVPFMAIIYIVGALVILVMNAGAIPGAIRAIFTEAFTGSAAIGATMGMAIRFGVARGVFTNEAGLGSAPIAHAAATTDHPVRQGIWGAFEVFVDTFMVCTMTALVLIASGVWSDASIEGAQMTMTAFGNNLPAGSFIVTFALILFPFTTILGWCYYGEKSAEYLVKSSKIVMPYRLLFTVLVFVGAIGGLEIVWLLADVLNALMAIPNMIGVVFLGGVVAKLVKHFFEDPERVFVPEDYAHLLKRN